MENHIIRLLRRIHNVDSLVDYNMEKIYASSKICILYDSGEIILDIIIENVIERLYYDYLNEIDDNSKEWEEMYNVIVKYIRTTHGEKIIEYYNKFCEK